MFRSTLAGGTMRGLHNQIGRMVVTALLIGAGSVLTPARAHFVLVTPDSWMSQDSLGGPQKLGPCGNEGGGTATGDVTPFRPGQTIEVTVDETIFHPGHYRVALAVNDRSELPPPPAITAVDRDPCGRADIQEPPIFPILADNLLPHTQPFDAPQTFTVTLPSDVTCTRCTLQVIEYMANHGMPCFYYHCADISIEGDPATADRHGYSNRAHHPSRRPLPTPHRWPHPHLPRAASVTATEMAPLQSMRS